MMPATPDSLFRISLKNLIVNDEGKVLVVKELNRTTWDLPGGGIDHGESLREGITRELFEEVGLEGDFTYRILDIDEPHILPNRPIHQVRLVFHVTPEMLPTKPGSDADEIMYVDPLSLKDSEHDVERRVYKYFTLLG